MGYFPVDDATLEYLRLTGRDEKLVALARDYFKAQGIFGIPSEGDCDYTKTLHLDLADVRPSIAGPKRPQDKIELPDVKESFQKLLSGLGKSPSAKVKTTKGEICDGSVLIAAITSCTNTSNPSVLVAAGLVAKKADELGIRPPAYVKHRSLRARGSSQTISRRRGFKSTSTTSASTSQATAAQLA